MPYITLTPDGWTFTHGDTVLVHPGSGPTPALVLLDQVIDYAARGMTRAELNALASELGVRRPEGLSTKADVVRALRSFDDTGNLTRPGATP